jgi:cytochrome b involved in lipid metabolism
MSPNQSYNRFNKKKTTMINVFKNPTQANHYLVIAKKVYSVDPLVGKRDRFNVFARTAISVQLLSSGEKYHNIGTFLNKDHSSIIHNVKMHPDRLRHDKEYKEMYFKFLAEIGKPEARQQHTFDEIKFQVNRSTKAKF